MFRILKKDVCIVSCGMIFKEGETNYNVDTRIGQNTFLKTPIQVDMWYVN